MFKKLIRKIILREKADSESFVSFLRKKGVAVGENVRFFAPADTVVDVTCPWLLSIGNNVNITKGTVILTHDYSWSVLKMNPENPGRILGAQSPTAIGNNVYIGMNSVITRGVVIGDNVVIGAGSVVTKNCESNCVYAGVPAKKIMTVDEFYKKREKLQLEEAKTMVRIYRERFGKNPPIEEFHEYFMLFCDSRSACNVPEFRKQLGYGQSYYESIAYMDNNKPVFKSYEDFLNYCISET